MIKRGITLGDEAAVVNERLLSRITKINIKTFFGRQIFDVDKVQSLLEIREQLEGQLNELFSDYPDSDLKLKYVLSQFSFHCGNYTIRREDEKLDLTQFLQKHSYVATSQMYSNQIFVKFVLSDTDLEYNFVKKNISAIVESTFACKQSGNKNILRNRYIRFHQQDLSTYTDVTIKVCNIFGEPLAAFAIYNVQIEKGKSYDDAQGHYTMIKIQKEKSKSKDFNEFHLLIESGEYLEKLMEKYQYFRNQYKKYQEPFSTPRTFKKALTIKPEDNNGDSSISSMVLGTFVQDNEIANGDQEESKHQVQFEEPKKFERKSAGRGMTQHQSYKNKLREKTVIREIFSKKKDLNLEQYQFKVQSYHCLGRKKNKLMKFTKDFEVLFFMVNKNQVHFRRKLDIRDFLFVEIVPKEPFKLVIKIKPKKVKMLGFQDEFEAKKAKEIFDNAMAFLAEKGKSLGKGKKNKLSKTYTWLNMPNSKYQRKNTIKVEQLNSLDFKAVDQNDKDKKLTISIDLEKALITFAGEKQSKDKLRLNANIFEYGEIDYDVPRQLCLNSNDRKYNLVFTDAKSRYLFETGLYNIKLPEFRLWSNENYVKPDLKVFTSTWNAGSADPPKDLSLWLSKSHECDLVAIGMQECNKDKYTTALKRYFSKVAPDFVYVKDVGMWEMIIIVFVKQKYAPYLKNLEFGNKATGIGGFVGNKGGVAIAFRLMETTFCFMSTHLAAKPYNMPLRKENFYELMKQLRFGDKRQEVTSMFDYFVFMGDTNFRVDYEFFAAVELINKNEHLKLLDFDQYATAVENDNFMSIFEEADIKFKPTYRRNRKDEGYSNKKGQCPSWTDRVLIKRRPNAKLDFDYYDSAEMFFCSDHRPVISITTMELEVPYVPRAPDLLTQNKDKITLVKLEELRLSYNIGQYESLTKSNSIEEYKFSIHFFGRIITKHNYTNEVTFSRKNVDMNESKMENDLFANVEFPADDLPLIEVVQNDLSFLAKSTIVCLLMVNDICIGSCDLTLDSLVKNEGEKTDFDCDCHLSGKVMGAIRGEYIMDTTE